MRRSRKNHPRKAIPMVNRHFESPTILKLIEQLERDVQKTGGKTSKTREQKALRAYTLNS